VVADLDLFGVHPQVRIRPLERPRAECIDLLIKRPAQRRDAVLGHPLDAELLHQPVDLPGRDAVDVRLEHDRDDRLLRAPPRLKKAREIAAMALARDQQLDLADPGLPLPGPIPVAVREPVIRRHLAELGTDLRRDLRLHQLPGDQNDRLPHEILKPPITNLRDDIGSRHPLTLGHRGVSFSSDSVVEPTSISATVVGTTQAPVTPLLPTRPSRAQWRGRLRLRGALEDSPLSPLKPARRCG
jgi:hypothetical protein